jgi:hemolysin III
MTIASSPSAIPGLPEKPLFRGVLHLAMAILAPAGLVLLLLLADSPRRYVGAAIFATSLMLLYTSSANYHVVPWSERFHGVMKRIDHSMIFVLIAGSYTPFCLVVLDDSWGIPMLVAVWTLAGLGALVTNIWSDPPRWVSTGLYLALGWIAVVAAVPVVRSLDIGPLAMLAVGGGLYTVGAVIYALKRPNPWPRVFGFHEVFHAFVIGGSVFHFALVAAFVM